MVDLTTFAILSFFVRQFTDRIRKRFPSLDGDLVVAFAVALGASLCFALQMPLASSMLGLNLGSNLWLDYIISGIAVATGAGTLHDLLSILGISAGHDNSSQKADK
ncbi:MAG: hypothetical protein D6800_06805 [Candidatus Zixiibacteriota bacterium]|nr:MAG: hypothetical protein D6800_06805 [candidate division Zixibacteria bacterium]